MNSMITIQYLYNSGFSIDFAPYFVVVDYYEGKLELPKDRTIIFIVTHAHPDHYSPAIFTMPGAENAKYILSGDVEAIENPMEHIVRLSRTNEETERKKIAFDSQRTIRVSPDQRFSFGGLECQTFGSTDQGISILFQINEVNFFHSGDLNSWKWPEDDPKTQKAEEDAYRRILHQIQANPIDVAFGVVDPRLGKNAFQGGIDLIRLLKPQIFIPMHFREEAGITLEFQKYCHSQFPTMVQPMPHRGDRFQIQV